MRFSPPLQYLERGPGGEVSESPDFVSFVSLWFKMVFPVDINFDKITLWSNHQLA